MGNKIQELNYRVTVTMGSEKRGGIIEVGCHIFAIGLLAGTCLPFLFEKLLFQVGNIY